MMNELGRASWLLESPKARCDRAAARHFILNAARLTFANESYENVGLCEIAADEDVEAPFAWVIGSLNGDESIFFPRYRRILAPQADARDSRSRQ
jgi:hypothetical protein